MDILKVLSRGTKKTGKGSQSNDGALNKLPSAGATTNPQLYHDQVRGQKRKRQPEESDRQSDSDLPEIDFFAAKNETTANRKPEPTKKNKKQQPQSNPVSKPLKSLSEDECRQILRSHRLKLTVLSKQQEKKKESKKSSKKSKKPSAEESKQDLKKHGLLPQPLQSFSELRNIYGISRRVAENLVAQGYRVPTEVQLGSLPLLLRPELALPNEDGMQQGINFLAVAPTGSGKTISFLLPAINKIMRRRALEKSQSTRELEAIIVVPTRELSHQIVNEGLKLLQGTGIKILAMKKTTNLAAEQQEIAEDSGEEASGDDDDVDEDEDENPEQKSDQDSTEIKNPRKARPAMQTDILVTTPTLLLNFLTSGPSNTQRVLPGVRDLVLDEADVLLDPLFREQTLSIWTACTNSDLSVSLWSATMGSNIETLIDEKLEGRATAMGVTAKPLVRLVVGLKDTAVPNIVHKLTYTASEQGKLLALRQLLRPTSVDDSGPPLRPPFLVFTQTIERASALHEELKYDIPLEAGGSSRIAALHSGLAESARATIMRKFRAGEVWVLITTDVLARGIDFAGINGVVNYDVPGSSAVYVHRAGRTGRAGRQGGVAVTFYTKEDIPFVKTVANVIAASEKQAGKTGDEASVKQWLLDALPNVGKADRKKLKERGVESRRTGSQSKITSKSGYERRKENNRRGAIEGSKKRKLAQDHQDNDDNAVASVDKNEEWGGLTD